MRITIFITLFALLLSCKEKYDKDLIIDYGNEIILEHDKLIMAHEELQKHLKNNNDSTYKEQEVVFYTKIDSALTFIKILGPIYKDDSFQKEFTRYASQMKDNVENNFTQVLHYISIPDSLITEKDIEEINILGEQSIFNIRTNENQFNEFYKSFAKKYDYEIAN